MPEYHAQKAKHLFLIDLRNALLFVALFCLSGTLAAQTQPFCAAAPELLDPSFATAERTSDPDTPIDALVFESGEGELTLEGSGELKRDVIIRRGDDYLAAQAVSYDANAGIIELRGDVQYSGVSSVVRGEGARFDYGRGEIEFTDSKFQLPDGQGHGSAGKLQIAQTGMIELGDVDYSSCPPGNKDWEIKARDIDLNTASGIGTARNLRLEFQGVPILYAPYLSFPISDARKSGILVPDFGTSARNGTEVRVPYYWNIAPNFDATISPRLLSKRGLQLNTEFRYLTESSEGLVDVHFLPNDSDFNANRTFVTAQNTSDLGRGWRMRLDAANVSDSQYFEDLGGSQSESSLIFLDRSLVIERFGKTWDIYGRAQAFQVLDTTLSVDERPYRRLPQISANAYWPSLWQGLDLNFQNELTYFNRDVGVTGWRLHSEPSLSLPFRKSGFFVIPEAGFSYTSYKLKDTNNTERSPDRALPRFSLDTGAKFERTLKTKPDWLHTVTPRLQYVHTPYRDQDDLPVFDTIEPDFNLVQIFRQSPLVGIDRIPDLDQVTVGVTNRFIDKESGKTLIRATLGQTRYLSAQGVSLPGSPPRPSESSDYVAELEFRLADHWNMDVGHQWNSESSNTVKSEFRIQYQPDIGKVVNLAYRYREDSLEQADLSFAWPLNRRWNMVGRYNYSLRDKTTLERFVGLEYESCCWVARVVARRYISRRDGTADSSVAIQLELKGLTSVGDPADKRLERGILGYRKRGN